MILLLLCGWNAWFHPKASPRIVRAGLIAILFAWEALFFQYGEPSPWTGRVRTDPSGKRVLPGNADEGVGRWTQGNVLKT